MAETDQTTAISRRGFLKIVGTGTALVVFDARGVFDGSPLAALTDDNGVLVTELFRPEDQLHLIFEFVNLRHDAATNALLSTGTGTPLMRVRLPRQHVTEQPVVTGQVPPGAATAPVEHRVAARSRLVFEVSTPLPLDVASLLDLDAHTLVTTTAAGDPDVDTTMIEVPADLRWSPDGAVTVDADVAPITAGGISQLHRFVMRSPGGIEFTPVFNASSVDGFARRIPNSGQRDAIVEAATEGPALSDRLWLTPFGAWADIAREWTDLDWIQRVQGGRDQYVQVVERGVLLPFGHQAVVTSTVTRQWLVDADGGVVSATIGEEHFAIAGNPVVEYPGTGAVNDGRDLPFQSIRIEDRESISAGRRQLEWTGPGGGSRSIPTTIAWEVEQGPLAPYPTADVRIAYTGTDRAGDAAASFRLPAVFVPAANLTPSLLADLVDYFASDKGEGSRRATVSREMAWADPFDGSRASTLFTSELDFSFRIGVGGLPVAPYVTRGVVSKPELLPPDAPPSQTKIEVVFAPEFLSSGNDPGDNPNAAFLDIVDPLVLPVGAEARAVLTPDFKAEEFNQTIGVGPKLEPPVPDAPVVWKPEDAFGAAAELLRGIKLADLVAPILFDLALPGVDIPEFSITELPESITQTYRWCPTDINSLPEVGFIATAETSLCVSLETVIALDLDIEASATIVFEVRNFTLAAPPDPLTLIEFDVNTLRAVAPSDGPVDLTFDVEEWRLGGLIAWLEPLITSLVPSGSAFDIDVTGTSIDTNLAVALPNLNLGVLEIRNFALGLSGEFPFVDTSEPRIEFSVGSRKDPVSLQIMQFGGGFSCALAFNAAGIVKIAIRAEVSARLFVVDVGFAEAYLEVGVSAAFIWREGDITFVGELWVEMALDLLGLVSATVRITARVSYDVPTEIVTFSGTIYWSVTALFTKSGSVPLGSTEFALGDGAGPSGFADAARSQSALLGQATVPSRAGSFGDAHTLTTWNDYVSKFAPET